MKYEYFEESRCALVNISLAWKVQVEPVLVLIQQMHSAARSIGMGYK